MDGFWLDKVVKNMKIFLHWKIFTVYVVKIRKFCSFSKITFVLFCHFKIGKNDLMFFWLTELQKGEEKESWEFFEVAFFWKQFSQFRPLKDTFSPNIFWISSVLEVEDLTTFLVFFSQPPFFIQQSFEFLYGWYIDQKCKFCIFVYISASFCANIPQIKVRMLTVPSSHSTTELCTYRVVFDTVYSSNESVWAKMKLEWARSENE